jgi:hypothetical protein
MKVRHYFCHLLQLADRKWGVISIRYRRVGCGDEPSNEASSGTPYPGVFPPYKDGDEMSRSEYNRWFPNGGYINRDDENAYDKISTQRYLRRIDD